MKRVCTLILLAFAAAAWLAAAPTSKSKKAVAPAKTSRKPTAQTAHSKAASRSHTAAGSYTKVKYVRGRHGKLVRIVSHTPPAPSYQLHPDPERYQQIQQALADRGYFKGQVNGQWGDDSVDALKRFQTDQKLDNDGHLNALTLTGLGLGPKHDRDVSAPSAVAPPSTVPSSPAPKTGSATPITPAANSAPPGGPPPPNSSGSR